MAGGLSARASATATAAAATDSRRARAPVNQIEQFLNTHLYDFKVKLKDLEIIK